MSSMFSDFNSAFDGPPNLPAGKIKRKHRSKGDTSVENFVPGPLSGSPDPDRPVPPMAPANDVLKSPQGTGGANRLESGVAMQDFFPLPGETADPEEWTKAFTLEGSNMPQPTAPFLQGQGQGQRQRPDGSISVEGKSTLWRQIPAPAVTQPAAVVADSMAGVPSEINHRLDTLTRQLEGLVTPTPLQSTAELFLFVAIGLLLLLAIDTLLRFATSLASSAKGGYSRGGARSWRGVRGRRY
jgi:hypothetical protein